MKKNLFLRLCLILVVAVTAYSCRTDQLPEQETFNNSAKFQLTSKRISLDEAKHKEKLVTELDKVEAAFKAISKSNINGRVIDYGNGVSIDTDDVIYFEKGPDFHNYTFHIKREKSPVDAPVENLVLTIQEDGTYNELLVAYNFTPKEKQMLESGIPLDAKGKVTVTELAQGTYNNGGLMGRAGETCVFVEKTMWHPCSSGDHNGFNANECNFISNPSAGTPPTSYVVIERQCTAQPVDYGLGENGEGGGGGPQNGPGGLSGNNPEETVTAPNLPIRGGTSPCQRLNNLWDPAKANAKPLIEEPTNGMYFHAAKEKGESGINFLRQQDGTITSEQTPHTDSTATNIKTGGMYYLAIHTHPTSAYPMFTWKDIYSAYLLIMRAKPYNRQHSALLLVAEDDHGTKLTYAITFETLGKTIEERLADPANLYCTHEEIMDKMDKNLERLYNEEQDKTNPNYERVFLQYNFGTNIGLYKANSNLTNWSKLSIDSDSDTATIIPTNCN